MSYSEIDPRFPELGATVCESSVLGWRSISSQSHFKITSEKVLSACAACCKPVTVTCNNLAASVVTAAIVSHPYIFREEMVSQDEGGGRLSVLLFYVWMRNFKVMKTLSGCFQTSNYIFNTNIINLMEETAHKNTHMESRTPQGHQSYPGSWHNIMISPVKLLPRGAFLTASEVQCYISNSTVTFQAMILRGNM